MGYREIFGDPNVFACSNCGRAIASGEKMLTVCASLETPNSDGSIEHFDDFTVSYVCQYCLSSLFNVLDVVISEANDEEGEAELNAYCIEQGITLELQCSDGISWSPSPTFTWEHIAQLLISEHLNMFGDLSEPLHKVFLKNLQLLGYSVPN